MFPSVNQPLEPFFLLCFLSRTSLVCDRFFENTSCICIEESCETRTFKKEKKKKVDEQILSSYIQQARRKQLESGAAKTKEILKTHSRRVFIFFI